MIGINCVMRKQFHVFKCLLQPQSRVQKNGYDSNSNSDEPFLKISECAYTGRYDIYTDNIYTYIAYG